MALIATCRAARSLTDDARSTIRTAVSPSIIKSAIRLAANASISERLSVAPRY